MTAKKEGDKDEETRNLVDRIIRHGTEPAVDPERDPNLDEVWRGRREKHDADRQSVSCCTEAMFERRLLTASREDFTQ